MSERKNFSSRIQWELCRISDSFQWSVALANKKSQIRRKGAQQISSTNMMRRIQSADLILIKVTINNDNSSRPEWIRLGTIGQRNLLAQKKIERQRTPSHKYSVELASDSWAKCEECAAVWPWVFIPTLKMNERTKKECRENGEKRPMDGTSAAAAAAAVAEKSRIVHFSNATQNICKSIECFALSCVAQIQILVFIDKYRRFWEKSNTKK